MCALCKLPPMTFMDICDVIDDALPLRTDKLSVPFTGGDTPVEVVADRVSPRDDLFLALCLALQ